MSEQKYEVRNYVNGDEEEISKLFNETYKDYAGYVPRTSQYWVWCCLERPDVENDGILILENRNSKEIIAYEVVGKSGNIWELCVKPVQEKEEITTLLLEKALRYAEKQKAETAVINVPLEDKLSRNICERLGFDEFSVTSLQIGVMNFSNLIKTLTERSIDKLQNFDEAILFVFIERLPWLPERLLLKISHGTAQIIDAEKTGYSYKITAKPIVLLSVLFGLQNPLRAAILRKLKIEPFWKSIQAAKFLSTITINDQWYYPRADYG